MYKPIINTQHTDLYSPPLVPITVVEVRDTPNIQLNLNMAYTNIAGKKLQSRLSSTLNESATSHSPALLSSQQSFAKRQLEKMGWTEGTGLGKNRTGRVDHVKAKQREDNMGLGREKEKAKEMQNTWWKDSVGGTLARLQQQSKDNKKSKKKKDKKKKKSKKGSKQSSGESTSESIKTYTDEELFAATGGARFGTKGGRRAEGKYKRTESGTELSKLEEKARASLEWNGRGNAEVVFSSKEERKKRKRNVTSIPEDAEQVVITTNDNTEDKESRKKRRKLEKKKMKAERLHQVTMSASEQDGDLPMQKQSKKKKKKSKKESKK